MSDKIEALIAVLAKEGGPKSVAVTDDVPGDLDFLWAGDELLVSNQAWSKIKDPCLSRLEEVRRILTRAR